MSKEYKLGFSVDNKYSYKSKKGLNRDIVNEISLLKNEPKWMREFRLNAYDMFLSRPMPTWGADLGDIDFDNIYYFIRSTDKKYKNWDEVPSGIKDTFDKIGIPDAEKKFLAGVEAQFESEVVYHNLKDEIQKKGIIFTDTDTALREHPDLFREYFSTVVPPNDNKFASLNSAVWSGGSFIYVPKGVNVDIPLQAYFRINAKAMGQFERTLIIADEFSSVHYIEGCSAPLYDENSLHSAVVEVICKKGSTVKYTTIQNWSDNVYNLVTKRAVAMERAKMYWVDGNFGSKVTMKYPAVYLLGNGSHGEVLSLASADKGQHIDSGSKMIHSATNTTSKVISKSISRNGGRTSYRGLVQGSEGIDGIRSDVVCDAMLLDEKSRSDTYPTIDIEYSINPTVTHEATVSKIGDEQLFYLRSRGLSEDEAKSIIISGFLSPILDELPMEYAVELNQFLKLKMSGNIG